MALNRASLLQYFKDKLDLDLSDLADDDALFSSGVLDSFSMVDLIMFVEESGGVKVETTDVTLDNFDSMSRIVAFVNSRQREEVS